MEHPRIDSGSIVLRLLVVGGLVLVLLIPTGMISALIGERERRKQEAVSEVASKWVRTQTLAGPIVTVPYEKRWRDADGKPHSSLEHLTFLPLALDITAALEPQTRHRGIYKVVLYHAKISARGQFSFAGLDDLGVAPENIRWQDAFVSLGLPDMRGIKEYIRLTWNGRSYVFAPGIRKGAALLDSGVSVKVPLRADRTAEGTADFSFTLALKGSEELNILPLGRTTTVSMTSTWPDPSFGGAFLPEEPSIGKKGFTASWKVLDLNRNYPQQWVGKIDVEKQAMQQNIVADAASLAWDIKETGRVSVYGIYFDSGQSAIKPDSASALKEIAKLLKDNPSLKLYVVGHTDNQGGLAYNLKLSKDRADAVVKALTGQYGVAANRLEAFGCGPTAPVASNRTEEGRAKNRRVELVEQ